MSVSFSPSEPLSIWPPGGNIPTSRRTRPSEEGATNQKLRIEAPPWRSNTDTTMKISLRKYHIVSLITAISLGTVAVAQPPPGPFGPGPRGPGRPGPGPGRIVELLVPPPPPPRYHRHYRDYSSESGSSSVARVQRALKTQGYYSGPVDGDAGSGTRAAIRSFRDDNGLESSSRIDGTLLRALGL